MTVRPVPRIATWLLKHLVARNDALAGDLLEEYRAGRSATWYWKQVVIAMCVGRPTRLRGLIISCLSLVVGVLIAVRFNQPVLAFILGPLVWDGPVIYVTVWEGFVVWASVMALAGLVLTTPVIFYEVWLVAAGPYAHKQWLAVRFAFFATGFFVGGALLSHFVLFPWAWHFLTESITDGTQFLSRPWSAVSLYAKLLLTCGLACQMPATVFFFARIGVVTPAFLVRNFGYAVALMVTGAAILTPTHDLITVTLTAVPLVAVYGFSVLIARRCGRAVQPR